MNIYYTGLGAIESGNHTTKQYLQVINISKENVRDI